MARIAARTCASAKPLFRVDILTTQPVLSTFHRIYNDYRVGVVPFPRVMDFHH